MDVIWAALGRRPSDNTDCIKIEEKSAGRFAPTRTALCQLSGADAGSVSLIDTDHFNDKSEAENASIVWANALGVQTLHISYGTLACPIERTDVDGPL
jgi:hypothetical protein